MDISSVQENNQTGRSSSPKRFTSEPEHEFDLKGRCSEVEEQKHDTTENVQNGSAEARVLESVSSSVEQLKHPEDSTKNHCCEPLWRPQQDATVSSLKQIELLAEGVTRKTSSPTQKSGLNHEFGSESLNSQPLEQKQVIDIENVQNGPVDVQKAECDNLCLEQVGRPSEEVTRKSCRDHSQPEDLTMRCGLQQFGLPLEGEATNSSLEELGPQPDDVSKNQDLKQLVPKQEDAATNSNLKELGPPLDDASKNQDLEQLGPKEEEATQNTSQSGHWKKGSSGRPKKGKNILKSLGSTRVLRSRSQEKSKAPALSQNLPDDGSNREKKRKKKKRLKNVPVNEFLRIRTRLRYLLTRMKYEQNLIDAYSGEGWKGQSLEKIKPEKELQRAKSEIFRCKQKIRDLFQRLDTSCAEGKLPESLFDSEGEIDSEDIFCAKCGSKELLVNNDIILCDGACERAFHQFCLEPPLLKEDIPPDDEGWLCPGCDCKVDCTDLLNDSQETNLSIRDSWEKVFPEAAAGNNLDDKLGFSSDDSEDDDYNPDGPELEEEVQGDESSYDESDFSSASDDLGVLPNNEQYLGLPSDDSEDDDYNPNGQDIDEQVKQESSSSDFTSDSEDFSVAFDDNRPSGEVQGSMFSTSDHIKPNGERSKMGGTKRQSLSDELFSLLDSGPGEGDTAPLSGKRHVERLDYKKLHDETYGNVSSDSSDEEYMDTAIPKRRKIDTGKVALLSPSRKTANVLLGTHAKDMKHKEKESERTPKRRTNKKPDVEGTSNSPAKYKGSSGPHSSGTKSAHKRLGEAVTQRLLESFEENKYPERAVKENLAKELSLTVRQVSKWFENARWSFNHPSHTESKIAESALNKGTIIVNELPAPEPRKVREDNAHNVFEKSESPKASPVVIQGCSGNVTQGKLVTKEGNGQNSRTPKSKKGKAKLDNQTDPISSMMEETPKQNVEVNSPKGLEVRRSGRIQSRSRKSDA